MGGGGSFLLYTDFAIVNQHLAVCPRISCFSSYKIVANWRRLDWVTCPANANPESHYTMLLYLLFHFLSKFPSYSVYVVIVMCERALSNLHNSIKEYGCTSCFFSSL